ncbi:MAG: hypothetical protein EH225_06425 [Calditrichaeota bacterium]|nr:TonB-dependent receptor [Calditrichota bacterium]RQW03969.1 MAG: hypothetical protein EH225_06425 [Calditrichota bacterium]
MKYHSSSFILIFYMCLLFPISGFSQSISGHIVNEAGEALAGVSISVEGTVLGAATDLAGNFNIQRIPPGSFTLKIHMLGYGSKEQLIQVKAGEILDLGTIVLTETPVTGEAIVVTAAKYEQKIRDISSSMSLINQRELRLRNIVTLDQALAYVPGVNINGSQMNIRGSSGYSRGVGSRVLFLMDGIPILTGDTREINFDVIPTYLISRVEILKGAGSALYGSSALGGVVNIITHDIEQSPFYYARIYAGMYSEPSYNRWRWSEERLYNRGVSAFGGRKLGKLGFQLGGSYALDDGYRQNDRRERYSFSTKFSWFVSPYQELLISANYMNQDRQNFLYWKDLDHALQPPDDQLGDKVRSTRYYISSRYRHVLGRKNFLTVRLLWFWNRFRDNISGATGNKATSGNLSSEIQYSMQLGQTIFTTGIEGIFNSAESNIFGEHSGQNYAGYCQAEFSPTNRWKIIAGIRGDYFDVDSLDSDYRINPKAGLTYSVTSRTTFRSSFGLGFRAPSLAEIFTSTVASGFQVIPNTGLKPERNSSLEAGLNHQISKNFSLDGSYFYNYFNDLIEGEFLQSGEVQFQNITRAAVQGTELVLTGRFFAGFMTSGLSYTYVDARDLDSHNFLRFRPRHLFYWNNQFSPGDVLVFLDYRFVKKYDRIDEKFAVIIPDADERVDAHIVDIRIAYPLQISGIPLRFNFEISNLFQYYHVDLVGSLAPLRQYTFSMEAGL